MKNVLFFMPMQEFKPPFILRRMLIPETAAITMAMLKDRYGVLFRDLNTVFTDAAPDDRSAENFIRKTLGSFSPDIVVITMPVMAHTMAEYKKSAWQIARLSKEYKNDIPVVISGIYPTSFPGIVSKNRDIDVIVLGEAENTLCEIVGRLSSDADFSHAFEKIDGIYYRIDGRMVKNPKTKVIENLDELPYPAYDLIDFGKYINYDWKGTIRHPEKGKPSTEFCSSRGCPARCIFCNVDLLWGKHSYRTRSPEHVLGELELLVKKWGIKEVHFWDDNLTFDQERMKKICRGMIDRKLNIYWRSVAGVAGYSISDDLLKLMVESGCYRVNVAVESGDEYVLHKIIRKPLKLSDAERIFKQCKKLGIETHGYFVIGFPGESKEQIMRTVKYAEDLDLDYVNFSVATPQPGTELAKICIKQGSIPDEESLEIFRSQAIISTSDFTYKDLQKMRASEWARINFKTRKKKEKVAQMLGLTLQEVDTLIENTLKAADEV